MIDSTDKKIATIGIELSNDFNSNEEKKAATPKAVKDGIENHEKKADPHSQYAMKESPTLSGVPKAPTAAAGNNTTQIANTAFVQAAILALISGAPTTLDTLKELAAAINNDPNFSTTISNALALKAPLLSPGLTGTPTAPTAPQATNNTQIATTAFVRSAISALVGSSPEALDTLNELAAALGNDPNFATTMTNALAGKQPLNEILTAYSALNTAANKLAFFDGRNSVSLANLTAVGRVLIGQESISKVLEYLGLGETAKAPYIASRGRNANGSWIIWSDGAIECMGGSANLDGLAIVTYPIALPQRSRDITIAELIATDPGSFNSVHSSMVIDSEITNTGFKARCQMYDGSISASSFSWRVYYAPV
ncbi:phage tail protein [Salmonella enterica]|nr:phage tail protein [Salmonella enterica]